MTDKTTVLIENYHTFVIGGTHIGGDERWMKR